MRIRSIKQFGWRTGGGKNEGKRCYLFGVPGGGRLSVRYDPTKANVSCLPFDLFEESVYQQQKEPLKFGSFFVYHQVKIVYLSPSISVFSFSESFARKHTIRKPAPEGGRIGPPIGIFFPKGSEQ